MKVLALTPQGNSLIDSWNPALKHFFPKVNKCATDTITIITPHKSKQDNCFLIEKWQVIHQAWLNINSKNKHCCLQDWRKILELGREIIPGLRLFKLKKERNSYFFLLNEKGMSATSYLNNIIIILCAWQHFKCGRVFIHGAGIVKDNQAFLFLGSSGQGKSTVSILSSKLGCQVLHDDHVIAFDFRKKYFLSDVALKNAKAPLRSVFLLKKDTKDKVIPISQLQTAKSLFKSYFETMAEKALFDQYLINAFKISAEIARGVPGYELHFTKSPFFWKVIEDELAL